jgi:hypothetical protein
MLLLLLLLLIAVAFAKHHNQPTATFSPASQPFVAAADRYYALATDNYNKAKEAKNPRLKKRYWVKAQADEQIAQDIMRNNGTYGSE